MGGIKARFLDRWCGARGCGFLRFDYSGHGESEGHLADGTIGDWRADACFVISAATEGPLVFVGSSMGAWLMTLTALQMPERVLAMIGIAAAPDFTEDLIWEPLAKAQRSAFADTGLLKMASPYSEAPFSIRYELILEARRHLVLRRPIALTCPVHLLHGSADREVPWQTSSRLLERLMSKRAWLTVIKDGDHRLSAEHELAQLARSLGHVLDLTAETAR